MQTSNKILLGVLGGVAGAIALVTCALLLSGGGSGPDPELLAMLPSDTCVVASIDVQRLLATPALRDDVETLRKLAAEDEDFDDVLAAAKSEFGIDPWKDIRRTTIVWSGESTTGGESYAVVLEAPWKPDKMESFLKKVNPRADSPQRKDVGTVAMWSCGSSRYSPAFALHAKDQLLCGDSSSFVQNMLQRKADHAKPAINANLQKAMECVSSSDAAWVAFTIPDDARTDLERELRRIKDRLEYRSSMRDNWETQAECDFLGCVLDASGFTFSVSIAGDGFGLRLTCLTSSADAAGKLSTRIDEMRKKALPRMEEEISKALETMSERGSGRWEEQRRSQMQAAQVVIGVLKGATIAARGDRVEITCSVPKATIDKLKAPLKASLPELSEAPRAVPAPVYKSPPYSAAGVTRPPSYPQPTRAGSVLAPAAVRQSSGLSDF